MEPRTITGRVVVVLLGIAIWLLSPGSDGDQLSPEEKAFGELQQLGVARAFELGAIWGDRPGEAATPGQYHLLIAGVEVAGACVVFEMVGDRVRCVLVKPGACDPSSSLSGLDEWWRKRRDDFENEAHTIASRWFGYHTVTTLSSVDGRVRTQDRPIVHPDEWKMAVSEADVIRHIRLTSHHGTATLTARCHLRGGGAGGWEADFVGWEWQAAKGGGSG